MKKLAAIILAAGKGTRMKSKSSKVAFQLAGKSMIRRVVDTVLELTCDRIVTVVGYSPKSVIFEALQSTDEDTIDFVMQKKQLGTGHAVMCAQKILAGYTGDVLILAGDVPLLRPSTLEELVKKHRETKAACTLLTAFLDDPGKYGRVIRDENGMVSGIVEFKDATEEQRAIKEWNTGIYCFKAKDMFDALSKISNDNQQKEYYLTDTLAILSAQGKTISSIPLQDLAEVSGVNTQQQLAELEDEYIDRIRRKFMNNGVMMHNPKTIYIEDGVSIRPDVEIFPHCVLKEGTLIESGSRIGPFCLIGNSTIGPDCYLYGRNTVLDAELEAKTMLRYGMTASYDYIDTEYE